MSANGVLLPVELVSVQGDIQLSIPTARAWRAMKAAATAAGITLTISTPYGGYRNLADQREIRRLGSFSGIAVAEPGYSTHGFGTRVDVANWYSPRKAWVLASAARFGFTREFGDRDPNHFKHDGSTYQPGEIPIPETEDTMQIMINDGNGKYGPVGGFYWTLTGQAWAPSTDRAMADRVSVHLDKAAYNATYAEWEWFKATAPSQGATVSNTAVLAAIAALDTQADGYQTALLAAIANTDEATLATFGLKRT